MDRVQLGWVQEGGVFRQLGTMVVLEKMGRFGYRFSVEWVYLEYKESIRENCWKRTTSSPSSFSPPPFPIILHNTSTHKHTKQYPPYNPLFSVFFVFLSSWVDIILSISKSFLSLVLNVRSSFCLIMFFAAFHDTVFLLIPLDAFFLSGLVVCTGFPFSFYPRCLFFDLGCCVFLVLFLSLPFRTFISCTSW